MVRRTSLLAAALAILLTMVGCFKFTTTEFTSTSSSSSNGTRVEIRDLKPQAGSETRLAGTWTSKIDHSGDYAQLALIEQDGGTISSTSYGWTGRDFQPLVKNSDGPVHAV